jgi:hypothetical protein
MTDAGLMHFAILKKLERLDLLRARVTEDGVNALQRRLPDVRISVR